MSASFRQGLLKAAARGAGIPAVAAYDPDKDTVEACIVADALALSGNAHDQPTDAHPDAALFAASAEAERLDRLRGGPDKFGMLHARNANQESILGLRAATLEGHAARARFAAEHMSDLAATAANCDVDFDLRVAAAVIRDLIGARP